jgi:hypothetical protein
MIRSRGRGTQLNVNAKLQYRSIELGLFAAYPSRKDLTLKVRVLIDFFVGASRARACPQ